jgi:GTP-binding protein YchF
MSIQAGLVGLPNVGKSTLFNALTQSSVPAENYPFCTIDPHSAVTMVPDSRLSFLQQAYQSAKIVPAYTTFVDIAGLVKGAAQGQGLGNQFLGHIKDVHLILHVLRCFEDNNITHAANKVDPLADYDTIMAELMLKDLESIEKRLEKVVRLIKSSQQKPAELKELTAEQSLLKVLTDLLNAGNYTAARETVLSSGISTLNLLSTKPFLIIANVHEAELEKEAYTSNPHYQSLINHFGSDRVIPVSAKIEYELSQIDPTVAQEMMELLGITHRSLDRIIQATYKHLGLITFFTCGPQEIHAWPIAKNTPISKAAGEIHSDLERGFICAEVFNYKDLKEHLTPLKVKDAGKIRKEGGDYIVTDGDIILVRFNV